MARTRRRSRTLGEVTKQDFVAIAGVLCRTGADMPVVRGLASYFRSANPRFDESRFAAAATCKKR